MARRSFLMAVILMAVIVIGLMLTSGNFVDRSGEVKAVEAVVGKGDFTAPGTVCAEPKADQKSIETFLNNGCHRGWAHDPELRTTGPLFLDPSGSLIDDSTHHRVRIFYSSAVVDWLRSGRPETGIAEGAIIVKEMYQTAAGTPVGDKLLGYATMMKRKDASWDGWFWSIYFLESGGMPPVGQFGYNFCLTCHASADNPEVTFSDLAHLNGTTIERQDRPFPPPPDVPLSYVDAHTRGPMQSKMGSTVAFPDRLTQPDPMFVEQYKKWACPEPDKKWACIEPVEDVIGMAMAFPPREQSRALSSALGPDTFLTSDQCAGCHDATLLFDANGTKFQNMVAKNADGNLVDLSPYGEWSASMMGLGGRDPVFYAQIESERTLRPELAGLIDETCFKCHGVMGIRQLHQDTAGSQVPTPNAEGKAFQHAMVYALPGDPDYKYGALARDGISCTVCHHIAEEGLGEESTFTANFNTGPANVIYGPFSDVKTKPMRQSLGITPRPAKHIQQSELCGSCHTVLLPKLPLDEDYTGENPFADKSIVGHEQTTFLEWRNSAYDYSGASPKTCQDCHMKSTYRDEDLAFKIANIQDKSYAELFTKYIKDLDGSPSEIGNMLPLDQVDLPIRKKFRRHTLTGMNVFVLEMFRQSHDILGVSLDDDLVQMNMVNSLNFAEESALVQAREETATVTVDHVTRTATGLTATVTVKNLVGHKLPSGVGFRRAWLRFQVLDRNGEVLWVSGDTNELGVILDGATKEPLNSEFSLTEIQPNYQEITAQNQVQIYEERHVNAGDGTDCRPISEVPEGHLTTSFLGRVTKVKDNRLLPTGWNTKAGQVTEAQRIAMAPCQTGDDPDFGTESGRGADTLIYTVTLPKGVEPYRLEADLFYQTIPPYYLRDRFKIGKGQETRRLYYIASLLNIQGTGSSMSPMTADDTTMATIESTIPRGASEPSSAIRNWRLHVAGDSKRIEE